MKPSLFALCCVLCGAGVNSSTVTAADAWDHIVVILDASGSMSEPMTGSKQRKMSLAKGALSTVAGQLDARTRLGVLVFGAGAPVSGWAVPLAPYNPQTFQRGIAPVSPSGKTPLGAYMKRAANALLQARQQAGGYGTYRLLVITDGRASDPELVNRHLPQVMQRGLTIDVIGVDMKQDLDLATKVHRYRRANDPQALQQALKEAFAELGGDAGQAAYGDAFEVLAALPDPVADGMLTGLQQRSDDPLP